jgi:repressor LexA
MPEPLTELERRVYHYLIDFLSENTFQPSIREIARELGIKSTKTVSDLLRSLERKGCIERDQSRSRGVRLVGYAVGGKTQPVPCFGTVTAGATPAIRPEQRRGFITVDRRFLPGDDVYFLKISGDAFAAHGIFDGDYVLVSPTVRTLPRTNASLPQLGQLGAVFGVFRALYEEDLTALDAPVS